MILAIDIGNSTVACGIFDGGVLCGTWRVAADRTRTVEATEALVLNELRAFGYGPHHVEGVALCSVVPPLTALFVPLVHRLFGADPLVVTSDVDTGLLLRYTDPRELGADRLTGAAMAHVLYESWLILVDLGTATTFSVVSDKGEYLGGAIAPGVGISAESLHARTAQLPSVPLVRPAAAIGRDTLTGLQSGVLIGHAAMVDGMVQRMHRELGQTTHVLATGGFAPLIAPLSETIRDVRPHLLLEGLHWLYRRNKTSEK